MSDAVVLSRLRLFLFVIAAGLFTGSAAELVLLGHWEDPVQFIPFGLCGLGLIVLGWVLLRPSRPAIVALRISMVLIVAGSLFGIYEHVSNNFAFEMEIYPNEAVTDALVHAFGGANPLLAPGILGLAALLAIAATYYHPIFSTRNS